MTSIISGQSQDPHSYEATARDELAVSRARVVITNGGHYDEFMSRLLSAAGGDRTVLNAVDIAEEHEDDDSTSSPAATSSSASASEATASPSAAEDEHAEDEHAEDEHAEDEHAEDEHAEDEHDHDAGENEHVWYDFAAMDAVAEQLADTLSDLEPDSRSDFDGTTRRSATVSRRCSRRRPISAPRTRARTWRSPRSWPDGCWRIAAWRTGPRPSSARPSRRAQTLPVRVLQETLDLMTDDAVKVLIYNEQTTGPQTDKLRRAAEDAGIPIVNVRESLPEGSDYLEWMDNTLNALRDALA